MGGKTKFENLLEPYRIGRIKTRNRMIKTAALMEFTLDQNKVFYEAVARGGVGIINVGSFDLVPFDVPYQLYVGDDKCLPGLTELARVIHKYGCPTFLTVLHFGPRVKKGTPGVEALAASAVDVVLARIGGDAVLDAVQHEAGAGDAVGIATHRRAEERVALQVGFECVESEHDVVKLSVAAGDLERDEDRAVFHDACPQTVRVGQCVDRHRLAGFGLPKRCGGHRKRCPLGALGCANK